MTPTSILTARRWRLAADPGIRIVVANLGLACCALEVDAAIQSGHFLPEDAAAAGEEPPAALTILLVAGTVTDVLAPAVLRAHADLPGPVQVVSFGACATSGGPYWDAPTVLKGIDQLLPVAMYVPGCPPRPEALVAALLAMGRP